MIESACLEAKIKRQCDCLVEYLREVAPEAEVPPSQEIYYDEMLEILEEAGVEPGHFFLEVIGLWKGESILE